MIGKETIQLLRDQIAPFEPPVLSLYLNVNSADPANERKAFVLRAREAMRQLELPRDFEAAVTRRLEQEYVIPEGRTMVLFAARNTDELFEVRYLQAGLPLLDLGAGKDSVAFWGRPYVAPLLFALDQKEHYAILWIDQDEAQCFEVFLGESEELFSATRDDDVVEWRRLSEARRTPLTSAGGVPARGAADTDSFADRMDHNIERFWKEVGSQLEQHVRDGEADRIILLGTDETTGSFSQLLPQQVQEMVVARLNAQTSNTDDWLPLVKDAIDEAELKYELALLDKVQESGNWGMQEVLALLRNRQADILIVPYNPDTTVHVATGSRVFGASREELEALDPDDPIETKPLTAALSEIAEQGNVHVEFVANEAEERLERDFAGIAALRRW